MRARAIRDDTGAVAAEFAVALPAIVLVLLLAAGALGAASRHVRLQDAAADAARILARGDPASRATSAVASAVPGAGVAVHEDGDVVCVTATAPALLALTLTATGCALAGGR
ncbi:TadE family type IV pilus minor pilin [Microbacterium sp. NPDC055910]|uniref:TadE family type IV pilus minor pilin n=1 Tax=Microbacterium sp. NPDC055910 TaxID=3345659 RepID=UPI0035D8B905